MRRRLIPPTSALVAFEAVARRRSCSEAAAALNLTQSAVSKQVRALEDFLGRQLFVRVKGGLVPTAAAERYLADIGPLLDALAGASLRLAGEAHGRKIVVLRVLAVLGDRWLMPRLPRLLSARPDIEIRFATFLAHSDLQLGDADIEIRYGPGPWTDADSEPLIGQEQVLVASPAMAARIATARDCLSMPRLEHIQARDAWREFCAAHDLEEPYSGLPIQDYEMFHVMIRAARVGLGIGLVPRCLIEEELQTGTLVNPLGLSITSRACYQLVVPHRSRPTSAASAFVMDWIRREARDWFQSRRNTMLASQPNRSEMAATANP